MGRSEEIEAARVAIGNAHDRTEYNTTEDYAAMDDAVMALFRAISLPPGPVDEARERFTEDAIALHREYMLQVLGGRIDGDVFARFVAHGSDLERLAAEKEARHGN